MKALNGLTLLLSVPKTVTESVTVPEMAKTGEQGQPFKERRQDR